MSWLHELIRKYDPQYRERDFLKKVHDAVDRGGKVLIPVFALGRVQELCILLDTYWDRMNLKVPIYFTMGLAETVSIMVQSTDYFLLIILRWLIHLSFHAHTIFNLFTWKAYEKNNQNWYISGQ